MEIRTVYWLKKLSLHVSVVDHGGLRLRYMVWPGYLDHSKTEKYFEYRTKKSRKAMLFLLWIDFEWQQLD